MTRPNGVNSNYKQEHGKHHPKITMRHLPVGNSEGFKQISHGAADFGAGEGQLTDKERKERNSIELPVVLIGIVPIYNLPEEDLCEIVSPWFVLRG